MSSIARIFENQPKLLSPAAAAELIGTSRYTIYDMRYRPWKYQIQKPEEIFIKNGKLVRIVTDKLKDWFISRNGR